jgi:peptide/nickel transport system ATP-binding protein
VSEVAPATDADGTGEPGYAFDSEGLVIEYPARGRQPAFRAIHGLDLQIRRGEVVGLVGESGSGKTTVGRAAVGLLPVRDGSLKVNDVEMKGLKGEALRDVRRGVSMVFQDPGSSLNPRIPIGESIGEPLKLAKVFKDVESRGVAGISEGRAIANRVEELLDMVELPRSMRNRYPHELSGGQRQRVGVARSLALSPKLLIADEPTSALDVSVQARVLEIFQDLQREHGFACLFISHDLAVVEMLSSRIAVLSKGHLVECDTREEILRNPKEDYTRRLITAVPVPDPDQQKIRREERDRILMLDAPSTLAAQAAAQAAAVEL